MVSTSSCTKHVIFISGIVLMGLGVILAISGVMISLPFLFPVLLLACCVFVLPVGVCTMIIAIISAFVRDMMRSTRKRLTKCKERLSGSGNMEVTCTDSTQSEIIKNGTDIVDRGLLDVKLVEMKDERLELLSKPLDFMEKIEKSERLELLSKPLDFMEKIEKSELEPEGADAFIEIVSTPVEEAILRLESDHPKPVTKKTGIDILMNIEKSFQADSWHWNSSEVSESVYLAGIEKLNVLLEIPPGKPSYMLAQRCITWIRVLQGSKKPSPEAVLIVPGESELLCPEKLGKSLKIGFLNVWCLRNMKIPQTGEGDNNIKGCELIHVISPQGVTGEFITARNRSQGSQPVYVLCAVGGEPHPDHILDKLMWALLPVLLNLIDKSAVKSIFLVLHVSQARRHEATGWIKRPELRDCAFELISLILGKENAENIEVSLLVADFRVSLKDQEETFEKIEKLKEQEVGISKEELQFLFELDPIKYPLNITNGSKSKNKNRKMKKKLNISADSNTIQCSNVLLHNTINPHFSSKCNFEETPNNFAAVESFESKNETITLDPAPPPPPPHTQHAHDHAVEEPVPGGMEISYKEGGGVANHENLMNVNSHSGDAASQRSVVSLGQTPANLEARIAYRNVIPSQNLMENRVPRLIFPDLPVDSSVFLMDSPVEPSRFVRDRQFLLETAFSKLPLSASLFQIALGNSKRAEHGFCELVANHVHVVRAREYAVSLDAIIRGLDPFNQSGNPLVLTDAARVVSWPQFMRMTMQSGNVSSRMNMQPGKSCILVATSPTVEGFQRMAVCASTESGGSIESGSELSVLRMTAGANSGANSVRGTGSTINTPLDSVLPSFPLPSTSRSVNIVPRHFTVASANDRAETAHRQDNAVRASSNGDAVASTPRTIDPQDRLMAHILLALAPAFMSGVTNANSDFGANKKRGAPVRRDHVQAIIAFAPRDVLAVLSGSVTVNPFFDALTRSVDGFSRTLRDAVAQILSRSNIPMVIFLPELPPGISPLPPTANPYLMAADAYFPRHGGQAPNMFSPGHYPPPHAGFAVSNGAVTERSAVVSQFRCFPSSSAYRETPQHILMQRTLPSETSSAQSTRQRPPVLSSLNNNGLANNAINNHAVHARMQPVSGVVPPGNVSDDARSSVSVISYLETPQWRGIGSRTEYGQLGGWNYAAEAVRTKSEGFADVSAEETAGLVETEPHCFTLDANQAVASHLNNVKTYSTNLHDLNMPVDPYRINNDSQHTPHHHAINHAQNSRAHHAVRVPSHHSTTTMSRNLNPHPYGAQSTPPSTNLDFISSPYHQNPYPTSIHTSVSLGSVVNHNIQNINNNTQNNQNLIMHDVVSNCSWNTLEPRSTHRIQTQFDHTVQHLNVNEGTDLDNLLNNSNEDDECQLVPGIVSNILDGV